MVVTKEELFLAQAPMFNFELNADQLLKEALKKGFVKEIGDNQYEINEDY